MAASKTTTAKGKAKRASDSAKSAAGKSAKRKVGSAAGAKRGSPGSARGTLTKGGKPRAKKAPAKRSRRATERDMPKFSVIFIDAEGAEHVAEAAAPDPAVAVDAVLDQAERLDEPWLDELVAVMVMHPTTWKAVRAQVLEPFRE